MLKKGILLFILFIFNLTFSQVEDSWYSKKDKIIIPFDFSNNLIIIDAKINGVPLKFILDTGTEKNILFSFPHNDTIELFNPVKTIISGVGNGKPIDALISTKNRLEIKEFRDTNFTVLILNENNINFLSKLGKEVNGIIGYNFFKNRLIEIDYDKKRIIVHKDRTYINKRRFAKYSKQEIELINKKPYVKLNSIVNKVDMSLKLLVDTGLSDGLWLFKNDSVEVPEEHIEDYLGFGLAGEIKGKRARIDRVMLSKYEFKDVLVAYPDSISFANINLIDGRNGSIGGELLKRFHLFIDYENELMYLKKSQSYYNSFNFNMSGIEVQHAGIELVKEEIRLTSPNATVNALEFVKDNPDLRYNYKFTLKPFFIVSYVRENSPAEIQGVLEKDKILSINNTKAHNFTIQKITELFQSEDGKKIKLEVEREGQILEIVFYLKKII